MARLTKYQRQAFVTAVMHDVPTVNYEEQAHKLVKDAAIAILPPQIQAIAADKKLCHYLDTTSHWFGYHKGNFGSVTVYGGHNGNYMTKEVEEKLDAIVQLSQAQDERLNDMQAKLKGAIESCTTDKMARERLPEFIKYLPEPEVKSQYLPAISNIVADLVTLGWPKDGSAVANA